MLNAWFRKSIVFLIVFTQINFVVGYPIDGYIRTGIRRLERLRLIMEGKMSGTMPVAGARKTVGEIRLRLQNARGDSLDVLPSPDPELQKRIDALFPDRDESYSLALLDITPGRAMRFAQRKADALFSPGSVGKLLIAAGIFTELQRLYPDSEDRRLQVFRERMVIADHWIRVDDHVIPVFDPENRSYQSRRIREGDVFSLFEWMDHMLSASANAAGSMVWKEAMLMRAFGEAYPPSYEAERSYFKSTPKKILSEIAMSVVNDPIRLLDIGPEEWYLASFFTRDGKEVVPSGGRSCASPLAFLKFLIALERGRVVDAWSSLEIKRLMYMTARRIRYASSPALTDAAVYFKSGSFYRFKDEPGLKREQYTGNVENVMNSVVIVEHPDGRIYLVVLMSNVLRKNSAVEHQTLATTIDRVIKRSL
ncbi:MAG: hypothetical protein ABIL68_03945 [bacterium]